MTWAADSDQIVGRLWLTPRPAPELATAPQPLHRAVRPRRCHRFEHGGCQTDLARWAAFWGTPTGPWLALLPGPRQ